ncbi:hypothetical protein F5882DRAFT_410302 [Hyaloscypha sp. PMI_1271]|nr:hypothetical protein F5882DRAFT_410302 [Hyaloscypha sp. PMI_1271]
MAHPLCFLLCSCLNPLVLPHPPSGFQSLRMFRVLRLSRNLFHRFGFLHETSRLLAILTKNSSASLLLYFKSSLHYIYYSRC